MPRGSSAHLIETKRSCLKLASLAAILTDAQGARCPGVHLYASNSCSSTVISAETSESQHLHRVNGVVEEGGQLGLPVLRVYFVVGVAVLIDFLKFGEREVNIDLAKTRMRAAGGSWWVLVADRGGEMAWI